MNNNFPDTPNTLIDCLMNPNSPKYKEYQKQLQWKEFLRIYHNVIRVMVVKSFRFYKWDNVNNNTVEVVISNAILALIKAFDGKKYDKTKSKFRFYLKSIINNKVKDFLSDYNKHSKINVNIDDVEHMLEDYSDNPAISLTKEEEKAFKLALLKECYEKIKVNFNIDTVMSFNGIYRDGKKANIVASELGIAVKKVSDNANRFKTALIEEINKKGDLNEQRK